MLRRIITKILMLQDVLIDKLQTLLEVGSADTKGGALRLSHLIQAMCSIISH